MRSQKNDEINRYLDELKTVRRELIEKPQNHFIQRKSYYFTLNNGCVIPREKILKNNVDGSAVIIAPRLINSNEFLVVIEPRVFTKLGVSISFPAGYIDKCETPQIAALRELREETGYVSDKLILLDSFYQDQGISSAYNHSYLALDAYKKYDQDLDENEIVRYMSLSYNELLEAEKMGLISDSNTKLTLCRIKEKGNK